MGVAANAIWLSTLRITADLLSFALFLFIARTYGREGSGEYSYAFAVAALTLLIATAGFEEYGVRQFSRVSIRAHLETWRAIVTAQALRVLVTLGLLAALLLVDAGRHARTPVVIELTVFLVGWGLSRTFFVPAMAAQAMKTPANTDLLCRGSAILVALLVGLMSAPDLPLLLISFPIGGVVLLWLAIRNARTFDVFFVPSTSRQRVIGILRETAPFGGSEVLQQFYMRADVLLIAHMLGVGGVGLYASVIKFVEVGIMPLNLMGIAAYPVLSRHAVQDAAVFRRLSRELIRILLFLSGWLAVGVTCLVPLVIVPLFGERFAAGIELLPLLGILALLKGMEQALYRILYANNKQVTYLMSLVVGTVLIVALNFALIPTMELRGALIAGIFSTLVVVLMCAIGIRDLLSIGFVLSSGCRFTVSLALTALLFISLKDFGAPAWVTAILACAVFPVLGYVTRLVPALRDIQLFYRYSTAAQEPPPLPPRVDRAAPDL